MSELMTFLVFIPLLYYAVVFWIKAARWFMKNWRDVREKAGRIKDAAAAAYREAQTEGYGGDR
jgi:hypothetical protein